FEEGGTAGALFDLYGDQGAGWGSDRGRERRTPDRNRLADPNGGNPGLVPCGAGVADRLGPAQPVRDPRRRTWLHRKRANQPDEPELNRCSTCDGFRAAEILSRMIRRLEPYSRGSVTIEPRLRLSPPRRVRPPWR